jgi:hypothetical protein
VKGILTINVSIQETTGYPALALEPTAYVRTAVGGVDNLTLNLGGFGEEDCGVVKMKKTSSRSLSASPPSPLAPAFDEIPLQSLDSTSTRDRTGQHHSY